MRGCSSTTPKERLPARYGQAQASWLPVSAGFRADQEPLLERLDER